jgi:hypothetical protein
MTDIIPPLFPKGTPLAYKDSTTRYLTFSIEKLYGLCPRSSYTLTVHKYNNVGCKCKNVGPLLGGAQGIITESLAFDTKGSIN